ncbi:MAG: hypothetical protein EOO56_14575 [Hymenobacter sp.]|nr:MAG: hypothetical protein EOO56_14575 [Hymenobacter sp.]
MKTLTIKLPQELSPEQEHDLKMELAGTLHTKGLLTTSEAATMVGIGRGEFIEQMGRYQISLVGESINQFAEEVADARRYLRH